MTAVLLGGAGTFVVFGGIYWGLWWALGKLMGLDDDPR